MEKKNMYYLIAAVVVIVVVAFLLMRKPAEVPATPPAEKPAEQGLPEPEAPTEYKGEANAITNAVCSNGKIGAVLTNVADAKVVIGKDLKVQVNSLPVANPGCDKTELEPGESTTCTAVNGPFQVVKGQNEVVVRIIGAKEAQATVVCS